MINEKLIELFKNKIYLFNSIKSNIANAANKFEKNRDIEVLLSHHQQTSKDLICLLDITKEIEEILNDSNLSSIYEELVNYLITEDYENAEIVKNKIINY